MLVRIHGSGVELDGRFRDRVETRLGKSLGRFGRYVHSVELQISDVNGPKGGADKRARCIVHLARRGAVVVEVDSADTRSLVDLLAQRMTQAIGRRIGRSRGVARASRRRVA